MSFNYVKIEESIEDTNFEYITNLDDYKALGHILTVISAERLKSPILVGIFGKISKMLSDTIDKLSRMTGSDKKRIDLNKLKAYAKDKSVKKIILVKNENYNCFASYPSNMEVQDKLERGMPKTVFYNVSNLETSGSISVVPTNANVFMSSLLYSYSLLFSQEFYKRQNVDVMINIAKVVYTLILSSFGKKSGLLVGSRVEKEMLFFLCASFIFSIYAKEPSKNSNTLRDFLRAAASSSGSSHLKTYFTKLSKIDLKHSKDMFNPENYNSLFALSRNAKNMGLLEISESDIKIQYFRLLGIYGTLGLENYIRFVAYIISTYIPNVYFNSTLKVYNKSSYEFLTEYYLKELYSIG
jgi:hypothetical protein